MREEKKRKITAKEKVLQYVDFVEQWDLQILHHSLKYVQLRAEVSMPQIKCVENMQKKKGNQEGGKHFFAPLYACPSHIFLIFICQWKGIHDSFIFYDAILGPW